MTAGCYDGHKCMPIVKCPNGDHMTVGRFAATLKFEDSYKATFSVLW